YQHDAERRLTQLVDAETRRHRDAEITASQRPGVPASRLLSQAARELLLAESSDWAFQIYQGTTVQYSTRRFESHIQRFNMIAEMLSEPPAVAGGLSLSSEQLALLEEIERRDNIFPEIEWRVYRS
ncbi:MAG: DUF1957 domain-containing protein, partial [Acidobacteria bacterium]|nr:DUF1957 domain-containing protein [Acidobacteriota bacterium]